MAFGRLLSHHMDSTPSDLEMKKVARWSANFSGLRICRDILARSIIWESVRRQKWVRTIGNILDYGGKYITIVSREHQNLLGRLVDLESKYKTWQKLERGQEKTYDVGGPFNSHSEVRSMAKWVVCLSKTLTEEDRGKTLWHFLRATAMIPRAGPVCHVHPVYLCLKTKASRGL